MKPFVCSIAIGAVLNLAPASTRAAETLCGPREAVYFSCAIKPAGKVVSVCAIRRLLGNEERLDGDYLQYRYGRPGKIELEFPADRAGSLERFRLMHNFGRLAGTFDELSFEVGGHLYTVLDNELVIGGDVDQIEYERGVRVEHDGQVVRTSACVGPVRRSKGISLSGLIGRVPLAPN